MTTDPRTDPPGRDAGPLLEREAELHAPFLEEAAARLRDLALYGDRTLTRVDRILDLGGGPGVASCLLARYFPHADVVAVAPNPALLARAGARAHREGLGHRVHTHHVELPADLDTLGSADLIWAGDVVHHLGDQQAALDALARVLRPGGMIAIAERGLSTRFLPRDIGIGRPGLQARLDAAHEDWFAELRAGLPGARAAVEDRPAMLARAGLVPTGTHSFLIDLPSPLDALPREHLHAELTHRRALLADRLDAQDLATLDALLDPDADTGILWRPDAFYLAATTIHTARACPRR
ncbi:SAM-dependent methyltransferase [Embleya scabrispora]|uniref:SAM-dependent methyltransferase n=1 Tax=Embleya scabrispora TaxID=159449 RepID=A0A1T3P661_9ACTN|nr:class I SAM-dependent methyltransferase [Embleya scabrispora]OPC84554.1 SAM-dependent methyltransferase [Embleya scabrispora]